MINLAGRPLRDMEDRLSLARANARLRVSFEFFPPATTTMRDSLWRAITRLAPMRPTFVSVTYGAGGSTRERTHETVHRIRRETDLEPAAHLTCVDTSAGEIRDIAARYWDEGIRHIVALRGDPPEGGASFRRHPDGYGSAVELVAGLKKVADFEISVAAYPEIHPEARSSLADIDFLKAKIDVGASRAITQFFFDPDCYFRFLDRALARGIEVPIVPGILPVSNFQKVAEFAGRCGASVPAWLAHLFEGLDGDPATRQLVAAMVAAEQIRRLQAGGISDFHFYTLNRADLVYAICHALGLRTATQEDDVREAC
ncbi:methylenetetrahydrofolate reductase [NAD(P)H] [Oceanibacterium hippocampi]|uniref:Methylenetetrahydrofolate reductase n=1 Tax=Oceanibacterium hippocampi TaxID=745714 RepID=A0A1Y5SFW9_9PROT|nr:methylenetetrahydrofolate reductase [NAD(P)H] [Oceanibacterium hippocampi]SLN37064.1 5,10-methylenetetrahydrofolate reductase [Oceanibacterium hippocampi]